MHCKFEEMPILIQNQSVGMFDGTCEIDIEGRYPTVESITLTTTSGDPLAVTQYETFQLFASAILKHFEVEISDARAELDATEDELDPNYGRLLGMELM